MSKTNKAKKYPVKTSKQALSNKIGSYTKTVLPNKLIVISEEVPSVESFALGICINAGSREDPQGNCGTAHFIEHALFRRTKNRNARQIATDFESLGAYYNAYTSKEFTCFYVRALKSHFKKIFELLADVVINPVFNEKDFKNEQSIILEEISVVEDDPEELIFDYGDKLIFGNHPLSNPIIGTRNSVSNISNEDLFNFHQKYYNTQNIIISIAGNVSHEQLMEEVSSSVFESLPVQGENTFRSYPEDTFILRQEITKQFQQSHFLAGLKAEGLNSKEKYILPLINLLFGEGTSSRLYQELREKHALAYNIYSTVNMMSDCGDLYIYAATDTKKIDILEKITFDLMDKMLSKKVTEDELNRAKEQLKTGTIMDLESMSSRMQNLAKNEFLSGIYENIPAIIEEINSITLKSVREIAGKYFQRDKWNVVIFHP
ncbi:MAG: pitrilysin family protein [FCB group bacterium]|jgi:predicted Zn-dependent peptidase